MPKFLEDKLKKEYGSNTHAVYGTLNKIGVMNGNKETEKGKEMEEKHDDKWKTNPFAKKYKEKNEAAEKKRALAKKVK